MRRVDKEKSILGDRARGAKIGASEEGGRVSESECRKREQRVRWRLPWARVWDLVERVPKTGPQGRRFLPPFQG
jgi:hypothetical protein